MKKRSNICNLVFVLFAMIPWLILSISGCVERSKYLAQVAEADSAKAAFQDEAKKNAALNEQVSRLNSMLAEQKAKIEKLEKDKEESARKINELSSDINSLNADLEKAKEAPKSEIDKFMSEITKLQGEKDEAKKKIEGLSSEVDRLTLKEKEAQGKITEISSALNQQGETKVASPEEERLREETARLEAERGDLKKQVEKLSSEIDRLNSQLSASMSELEKARGSSAPVPAPIIQPQGEDIAKLEAEREELKKKVAQLSSETDRLNSELEKARGSSAPVPLPIIQTPPDEEMKSQIARLEEEKRMAEKRRNELEAESKKASSELETARSEAARKQREIEEVKGTYESLLDKLKKEVEGGNIKVEIVKEGLSVKIMGRVLFASGSDKLSKGGREVLDRVSGILKDVRDKMIRIEGHTDNKLIGPKIIDRFPTNWELSTSRAAQVVRYLAKSGVDPKMLSAAGLSMYYPVATNETKEGREQNRRIEIILYPKELARVE